MTGDQRPRFDLFPVLVLGGLALLIALGFLVFPWLFRQIQFMDCLAAGYGNCR